LFNASFAEVNAGNAWLSISLASSFSAAIILPASLLSIVFSTTNSFFVFAVLEAILEQKERIKHYSIFTSVLTPLSTNAYNRQIY